MNKIGILRNVTECSIHGPERAVRKHVIKTWFLEKIALLLVVFELFMGAFSLIPAFKKKACDSTNCASSCCQMMQDNSWLKRFVGNDLNIHGVVLNKMLNLGDAVFHEVIAGEENKKTY